MTNREIEDLMRFFDSSSISKVKIKNGEFSLEIQKGFEEGVVRTAPAVAMLPNIETVAKLETVEIAEDMIKSPMVGTFYSSPSPDTKAFVKAGSIVKKGEIVGIIEAMKIMNEFEAGFDCKIIKTLLEDGQPVEHGMPIFAVERV
jgi:acetyl-CoA carboxylase biotin carboxyl carrier protein